MAIHTFETLPELFMDYLLETAEGLEVPKEDIRTVCFAYQSMFIGFLLDWLRHGMRDAPNIMLNRTARLMQGSTMHILENSKMQPTDGRSGDAE